MSTGTLTLTLTPTPTPTPTSDTTTPLGSSEAYSPEERRKIEEARRKLIEQAQKNPTTEPLTEIVQLRPPVEAIQGTPPTTEPLFSYNLQGFRGPIDNLRLEKILVVNVGDGKTVDIKPENLYSAGLTVARQEDGSFALTSGTAATGGSANPTVAQLATALGIPEGQVRQAIVSDPQNIPPGVLFAQVKDNNGHILGHIIIEERQPDEIPGTPGVPGSPGSNVDVAVTANREQTPLGHAPRAHLHAVPGGGVSGTAGLELNSEAFGGVAQVTASTNVFNDKVELLAGGTYLLSNGPKVGNVEGKVQLLAQAGYRVTDRFKVVGGGFQLFDAQTGGTTSSYLTTVDGKPFGETQSSTSIDNGNPGGLYAGVNAEFALGPNTGIKTQGTVNQTLWGNPYGTPTPTLRGDVQLQQHLGDFSLAVAAGTSYRTGPLPKGATRANYNLTLAGSVAVGPKPGGWESTVVGGKAIGTTPQVTVTPKLTATTMNHDQNGSNRDVAWLTAYQVQITEEVTNAPDGTFSGAWVVRGEPKDIPGASAQAFYIGPVTGISQDELNNLRTKVQGAAEGFTPNLQRSGVTRKLVANDAAVAQQLLTLFQEKIPDVPVTAINPSAIPTEEDISATLAQAEKEGNTQEIERQRTEQFAPISQATKVLADPVTRPLTPEELEQRRLAIATLAPNGTIDRVVIDTDGELVDSQAGVAVDPQNIIPAGDPLHSRSVNGNDPVPDGALNLVTMGPEGIPVAPKTPQSLPGQVDAANPNFGEPGITREEMRRVLQQAGKIT